MKSLLLLLLSLVTMLTMQCRDLELNFLRNRNDLLTQLANNFLPQ